MTFEPFRREEREAILRGYAAAMQARRDAAERRDADEARRLLATARGFEERYRAGLPRVAVATCPFDDLPLIRTFDPFGLDGLWWAPDFQRPDPRACRHFCLLRGALNFHDLLRRGGSFEVHTGPEVPHVIPRILSLAEMLAVVGELAMEPGYTAYTIAYFTTQRPPVEELTADWPGKTFSYRTALGEQGWKPVNDPIDFELRPWIEQGRLRWCAPGSANAKLADDAPAACPYLDLPGERTRLVVKGDVWWSDGLPDGEPLDHLD